MLANHRNYLIYTEFYRLLYEPFVAIDVFGRADGHPEMVAMRPPSLQN